MLLNQVWYKNPWPWWQVPICSVWLSLWADILLLSFWPLYSNVCLLFPLLFFLFLSFFPVFLFLIVRQFLDSPSCGSSTGDAQSSLNCVVFIPPHLQWGLSVLLCPDPSNMFIGKSQIGEPKPIRDLEEMMNSSSLTGRHMSIPQGQSCQRDTQRQAGGVGWQEPYGMRTWQTAGEHWAQREKPSWLHDPEWGQ